MNVSFLTVFCLCLPAWNALRVSQPYRVVGQVGEVQLYCSYYHSRRKDPEELTVTLYRGRHGDEKEVCRSFFTNNQTEFRTKAGVGTGKGSGQGICEGRLEAGRVNLTLSGLMGNDTDMYRCAIEVLYPPPYIKGFGDGTLLYIPEEPDCPATEANKTEKLRDMWMEQPLLGLAVICLLLVLACCLVFVLYQVLQRKKRFGGIAPMISNNGRFGYGNFQ